MYVPGWRASPQVRCSVSLSITTRAMAVTRPTIAAISPPWSGNPTARVVPITSLMILEFETVVNQEAIESQAYTDFRDNLDEADNDEYDNYELPF